MTARYPTELEQPGLLRDGRSVLVRPVMAADEEAMLGFSRRLSRRTAVLEVTIDPLVIGRLREGVAAVSPAVRIGRPVRG